MICFNTQNTLKKVERFEKTFAEFVGSKYAVAVSSGTMADTIALATLKAFFRQRDVILPALTFIAQANAVYYNQLNHIFYDEGESIQAPIETTLCYFPVQLMGRCTPPIAWGIPTVEDACEALGSTYAGKMAGTFGDMGTYSFYNSHTLALGEGGMIVTDNQDFADVARKLRNHGSRGGDVTQVFKFDHIGFNGKMMGDVAERGLKKMRDLPKIFKRRNEIYLYLGGQQAEGEFVVPHGFMFASRDRDNKMRRLERAGIESRRLFSCIPTEETAYRYLGYERGDFPKAELASKIYMYVPCHENLTDKQVEKIKKIICV